MAGWTDVGSFWVSAASLVVACVAVAISVLQARSARADAAIARRRADAAEAAADSARGQVAASQDQAATSRELLEVARRQIDVARAEVSPILELVCTTVHRDMELGHSPFFPDRDIVSWPYAEWRLVNHGNGIATAVTYTLSFDPNFEAFWPPIALSIPPHSSHVIEAREPDRTPGYYELVRATSAPLSAVVTFHNPTGETESITLSAQLR